jgi:hypothetical protein
MSIIKNTAKKQKSGVSNTTADLANTTRSLRDRIPKKNNLAKNQITNTADSEWSWAFDTVKKPKRGNTIRNRIADTLKTTQNLNLEKTNTFKGWKPEVADIINN